ncbi:MAG: hypothetical protein CMD65_02340 [Gammaproteobacteria bacterium]|nr:hypothetical protein [Gammaproteobacteria bacterium]
MNSIINIKTDDDKKRVEKLYLEFLNAWNKTSSDDKKEWVFSSIKLFGKLTLRRSKGFVKALFGIISFSFSETVDFGKAIYKNNAYSHIKIKKIQFFKFVKKAREKTINGAKNVIWMLKNNPNEAGPLIVLGVLGFFIGSGGFDGDEGIPDLDIAVGGIGNHRSIFFHSIISAVFLETMIFSSVKAIKIIHSNLDENHDKLWDDILGYEKWAEAFVSGACIGIAYHLMVDGTIQGNKAYVDLPIKDLSMETHNTILVSNSIAEGIDVEKKLNNYGN